MKTKIITSVDAITVREQAKPPYSSFITDPIRMGTKRYSEDQFYMLQRESIMFSFHVVPIFSSHVLRIEVWKLLTACACLLLDNKATYNVPPPSKQERLNSLKLVNHMFSTLNIGAIHILEYIE